MHAAMPDHREILHAHLFAGLGGGARGFNRASARVGSMTASFRCLGGIDVDAAALADFERLGAPVDAYGVGSALLRGSNDFTADIVVVDGRPGAKVGRRFRPNPRLERVD